MQISFFPVLLCVKIETRTKSRLRTYCIQRKIDIIDNSNIEKENLGIKKLHLSQRGKSVLANNFAKYLRSYCLILE